MASEYALEFFTSNIATEHTNMAVTEGFIEINSSKHVILMHKKSRIGNDTWQRHYIRLQLPKGMIIIRFSTAKQFLSFGLDMVSLKRIVHEDYLETSTHEGHLYAFSVFSHDWSSIHASWNFEDPESGIAEYMWGIGKTIKQILRSIRFYLCWC